MFDNGRLEVSSGIERDEVEGAAAAVIGLMSIETRNPIEIVRVDRVYGESSGAVMLVVHEHLVNGLHSDAASGKETVVIINILCERSSGKWLARRLD